MKIHKRQIEEIRVIGSNVDRNKVLDALEKDGYTILRLGPRRRKNGWSWDVSQFEIIASKSTTKWYGGNCSSTLMLSSRKSES